MIIAKLYTGKQIFIKDTEDGGELESFSLLKLSLEEFCFLFKIALAKTGKTYEFKNDMLIMYYEVGDSINKAWKYLVKQHSKNDATGERFIDKTTKFKTQIPGTSALIRDQVNHIIRIAKRKGDDITSINRLCISNAIRERFFNDVKYGDRYKKTGKYEMDSNDGDLYKHWSNFMNVSFIKQSK